MKLDTENIQPQLKTAWKSKYDNLYRPFDDAPPRLVFEIEEKPIAAAAKSTEKKRMEEELSSADKKRERKKAKKAAAITSKNSDRKRTSLEDAECEKKNDLPVQFGSSQTDSEELRLVCDLYRTGDCMAACTNR